MPNPSGFFGCPRRGVWQYAPTKNRRLALFPGAFRPPHQAHFAAIVDLVSRPDVDEVIMIIANRCRYIPGTTRALDAEVARRMLSLYLQNMPKVRVEIARHDAISHALSYVDQAMPGDSLLFCIGEADFERGDDRFAQLLSQKERNGVLVSVVPAPTASFPIRATALREALAMGEAGRADFMSALPPHLHEEQRDHVWLLCRNGLRPIHDIVEEKLRLILDPQLLACIDKLTCVVPDKLDPVFRAQLHDGRSLFIKYAGDTTEAGSLGDTRKPKPRRRLAAERRALDYFRSRCFNDVELAEVISFDKETLTLVMSEVCPGGTSLQEQLHAGLFDPQVAAAVSRFLADCHTVTENVPALWGEHDTDLQQWRAMLGLRTSDIESPRLPPEVRRNLQRLKTMSDEARTTGFFHLDCCPKNIQVGQGKIGVIDLELCSSVGDPAYDLGIFLGHYVLRGLISSSAHVSHIAISAAIDAYRQKVGQAWLQMEARVVAFAGASLLASLARDGHSKCHGIEKRLEHAAALLLSQGVRYCKTADQWFREVLMEEIR
jgi:hypothetical protein